VLSLRVARSFLSAVPFFTLSCQNPESAVKVPNPNSSFANWKAFGTLVIIAGLALALRFTQRAPEEPLIDQRPVSFWTSQVEHAVIDHDLIAKLASHEELAIPALIKQLATPKSIIKDSLYDLWQKMPSKLRERFAAPKSSATLRAGASWGLMLVLERNESLAAKEPLADQILPAVQNALKDDFLVPRLNAAVCLGYCGSRMDDAIAGCEEALKDKASGVRFNATHSLERLGKKDRRAIPLLRQALADPNPDVRKRASEALTALEPVLK
jgi:hypothetical protein